MKLDIKSILILILLGLTLLFGFKWFFSGDKASKERVKQFGKDYTGRRTKNAPKKIRDKKGFIDRMTLSEIERQKMIKVIDEILLNKKNRDTEITEKESNASKIVKKNVESLKKMAEKEGLTINQLIKMLKSE